jgi:VanZ family protein
VKSLRWILALYLLVLLVAVSYPVGPSRHISKRHYLNDKKSTHVDALVQDVAQNIVMFLPAGYLGIHMVGRTGAGAYVMVVLACGLLSFGIESVQHSFLPWRYSTWIDIVSNTTGGLAGTGLAWLMSVPQSADALAREAKDARFLAAGEPPPTS